MTKTTEARWRAIIRDQERSGLRVREYAATRGLAASTLFWWRSKIRRGQAEGSALVPVEIIDASQDQRTAGIEVRLGIHASDPPLVVLLPLPKRQ